jgi:hypothetical protein
MGSATDLFFIVYHGKQKSQHHCMRFINRTCLIYMAWIVLHFGASNLYNYFCVPLTVKGLLLSPFMTSTPQCTAIRWTINQGASQISTMWVILASMGMEFISFGKHDYNNNAIGQA